MRKFNSFPWAIVIALTVSTLQAQNYSMAKKVYYTPIEEKIYFAIDMNYLQHDSLLTNGEAGHKKVPNTIARFNKDVPTYEKNGDYQPGDVLKILVQSGFDMKDEYAYIKIVGRISDDILMRIDKRIHEKADATFGAGKLMPWPDQFIEDKGLRGKVPNEKDVDADYYILSSVENFTPNYMGEYYERTGLMKGETGNLVVFYVDEIADGKFAVKEMDNLTDSFCRINIFWKERADKKGKKVGGTNVMDLTREDKVATNTYEKEIDVAGEFYPEVNGWSAMNGATDELVKTNSEFFEVKVMKAIDKAFELK